MWSFLKGLLLIKDRSVAKEMVDEDQSQNTRHRSYSKRINLKKRWLRRAKFIKANSTKVKKKVYYFFSRFLE